MCVFISGLLQLLIKSSVQALFVIRNIKKKQSSDLMLSFQLRTETMGMDRFWKYWGMRPWGWMDIKDGERAEVWSPWVNPEAVVQEKEQIWSRIKTWILDKLLVMCPAKMMNSQLRRMFRAQEEGYDWEYRFERNWGLGMALSGEG